MFNWIVSDIQNIRCLNIYETHVTANIGCLNIHSNYVTTNNSTTNNFEFFLVLNLKKYTIILDNNALDKRGKKICVTTYLETKSFKTVLKLTW